MFNISLPLVDFILKFIRFKIVIRECHRKQINKIYEQTLPFLCFKFLDNTILINIASNLLKIDSDNRLSVYQDDYQRMGFTQYIFYLIFYLKN